MVLDSLNVFSDDHTSTTTTLTPTTLKNITQIFESDDCLKNLQHFEQSGFVPPLPPPPQQQQQQQPSLNNNNNNKKPMSNSYCGGTTTIVTPIKFEPPATIALKVEKEEFSDEDEDFDQDDDEEYQPKAKKRMQTRNGGNKRTVINVSNNNNDGRKEPAKRKRKGNMKDDYDDLPPTERQRLIMRRERNKQAAARCRQRREDLTQSLMNEVKMWEGKKNDLEEEIQQLRSQKEELEYILQAHSSTCGLMTTQTRNPAQVVAVKSEPGVIVEPIEVQYMTTEQQKRHRPSNLSIPISNVSYLEQSGPEGVLIETPSTVIPCFDNFLTSSGLTPVVSSITTPGFFLNTPVSSCSYQQRSKEVPDLNTPGETVSLVSL